MDSFIIIKQKFINIAIIDIILLTSIYTLPSFSHMLPVQIYIFEPMRIVLFFGYIFSQSKYNIAIMALTIPLFSMSVSGHPELLKAIIMSIELFINILFMIYFYNMKKYSILISLLVSTISSKIIYYFMKYLLHSFGLIAGSFISTNIENQVAVLIIIALIFSLIFKSSKFMKIYNQ